MINEASLPTRIVQLSLLLLTVATVVGYFLFSPSVGLGVAAGGSIAILNFVWQRRTLRQLLTFQIASSPAATAARFVFRLSFTAIALYFILVSGRASIFGLLAGLSVIVAVILIITLYSALHKGD